MRIHQGDVILESIKNIPVEAKYLRDGVVVRGEVTGHSHTIEKSKIYEKDNKIYVEVTEKQPIIHPDHPATVPIKIGNYSVRIQQEYFPDGSRQVKD